MCLHIDKELPEKWHEECGVFGVVAPGFEVARLTYFGLFALQHRGQESAGIVVQTDKHVTCHKDMGLVTQAFNEKLLSMMHGYAAIGHVRYSTTGSSIVRNAQPIEAKGKRHIFLAHNGNLVNSTALRNKYENKGISFSSTTDSEIMAEIIADSDTGNVEKAIIECMEVARGAFSMVIMAEGRIFALRDPHGIRPLCLGKLNNSGWVVASETCALDIVGADFFRDVAPGELVEITATEVKTIHCVESPRCATCIFEFIYFARPDSYLLDRCLYRVRESMGQILAREAPADADVVISVPDSGTPAAIGYAKESGIPFQEGLIKNRYIGRTFIQPDQRIRAMGIKMKLNPLRDTIEGKRIVIVDDSIVRGTTSSKIIQLLRDSGAKEVHMRVSSPPVKNSCFYGIDTATASDLIANSRTVEQIREIIKPDTLKYLSIDGLVEATGLTPDNFCLACFNNDYPISIPRQLDLTKMALENHDEVALAKAT